MKTKVEALDLQIIAWSKRAFIPFARIAIFVVFFYFGLLKLLDLSPASPLAIALTDKTIGAQYFDASFMILAIFECAIGVLMLLPRATRIAVPLLFLHLIIVSSPLVLVPDLAWDKFLVPSLEGQYIIKNVVIAALAIGVAAQVKPLIQKTRA